jgi:hypothetical protein
MERNVNDTSVSGRTDSPVSRTRTSCPESDILSASRPPRYLPTFRCGLILVQRMALLRVCLLHRPSQRSHSFKWGASTMSRSTRQREGITLGTLAVTCAFFIAADWGLAWAGSPSNTSSGKFGGASRQHAPGKTGQGGTGSGASPGMGSGSGMGSAGSGHSTPGGQSHSGSGGPSKRSGPSSSKR